MITLTGEKILVSPLDWGLGHASRIVPLVKQLEKFNEVKVACSKPQLSFLQKELPSLEFFLLPSYDVRYNLHAPAWISVVKQIPRLKKIWGEENKATKAILNNFHADTIISDNRYGVYSGGKKNIFLTHQLKPIAPFLNSIFYSRYKKLLEPFEEIWCPDNGYAPRLSGKLSEQHQLQNVQFIGPLSRFSNAIPLREKKYDYLLLISGPEPVRSAFEEKLLQQYSMSEKKIALVRGTENAKEIQIMKNIAVWNTADTETLTQLFSQSEKIICRSGYSSLMDLHAIQRKAVLVPTPGQTEQEYLAKHWKENFGFEVLKLGV